MKKACFLVSFLSLSYAISAVAMQVAVVDGAKIIESSSAYQAIKSQIEKKAQFYQEETNKMQEKLQKQFKALEGQKSVLSKAAYQDKEKAFGVEVNKAQQDAYAKKISLEKAYTESVSQLETQLTSIVQSKSKSMGLDMVLNKPSVVYHAEKLDITEATLQDLNTKMPHVDVKFEANKEDVGDSKEKANS